jgi:FkbM family methyltransferase
MNPEQPYYSQHGEDALILAAFPDRADGFFVEVGCIDGRRFSNTLALEEQGWRGLCIEAHPDYIDLIRAARPGSTVVHAAAAEEDRPAADFFANHRGALSTLDPALEERFARDYAPWFGGFTRRTVPMRTLTDILDETAAPTVDVLSIDVDGTDERALRGLDLTRHRPRLIVIEADDDNARRAIDALLLPAGYHPGPLLSGNAFYFLEPDRLARIAGRRLRGTLVHTRHPLDDGEDQRVPFDFTVRLAADAAAPTAATLS